MSSADHGPLQQVIKFYTIIVNHFADIDYYIIHIFYLLKTLPQTLIFFCVVSTFTYAFYLKPSYVEKRTLTLINASEIKKQNLVRHPLKLNTL